MSRWSRVTALFEQALELDPDAREQLLTRAAETDAAIAHEVRSLLETHARAGTFLETPAWAADPELLTEALDAPHDEIGRQLGPYRLKEEIGRGGMFYVRRRVRRSGSNWNLELDFEPRTRFRTPNPRSPNYSVVHTLPFA